MLSNGFNRTREVREVVPVGWLDPEVVVTPETYVDRIVQISDLATALEPRGGQVLQLDHSSVRPQRLSSWAWSHLPAPWPGRW